jgi:hypothetical protein
MDNATAPEMIVLPSRNVAVYDSATAAYWEVSRDDAADLCARIRRGDADAYSQWCAETSSVEIMPEDAEELGLLD